MVEFDNKMNVHPNRYIQQFSLHYRFSRTQNQRGVGRELKGEDGSLCNKSTFYDKLCNHFLPSIGVCISIYSYWHGMVCITRDMYIQLSTCRIHIE